VSLRQSDGKRFQIGVLSQPPAGDKMQLLSDEIVSAFGIPLARTANKGAG